MRATQLATILEHCDEFIPGDPPEYFFDRNPENFSSILDIFRTGYFHVSEAGCALVLQKDLEYWIIDELMMEACCALKYYPQMDLCQNEKGGRERSYTALYLLYQGHWKCWNWIILAN